MIKYNLEIDNNSSCIELIALLQETIDNETKKIIGINLLYILTYICICKLLINIVPCFVEAKHSISQEIDAIDDMNERRDVKKHKKESDLEYVGKSDK